MESITFRVALTDRRSDGDEVFECRLDANETLVSEVVVVMTAAAYRQALKQTAPDASEAETAESIVNSLVLGCVMHAITPFVLDEFLKTHHTDAGSPTTLHTRVDAAASADVFALLDQAIEQEIRNQASLAAAEN